MSASNDDWFSCHHCGAALPVTATYCRECGASAESGWNDGELDEDGGDDFDYDEYVSREFGQVRYRHPFQWVVWGMLALAVLYFIFAISS